MRGLLGRFCTDRLWTHTGACYPPGIGIVVRQVGSRVQTSQTRGAARVAAARSPRPCRCLRTRACGPAWPARELRSASERSGQARPVHCHPGDAGREVAIAVSNGGAIGAVATDAFASNTLTTDDGGVYAAPAEGIDAHVSSTPAADAHNTQLATGYAAGLVARADGPGSDAAVSR
jgi:hypothetical protein